MVRKATNKPEARKAKKLKVKKETLRDLTERDSTARRVKGGVHTNVTDVLCSRGACGPTWGAGCSVGCETISVNLCVKR